MTPDFRFGVAVGALGICAFGALVVAAIAFTISQCSERSLASTGELSLFGCL